jgi:hypothetical protein
MLRRTAAGTITPGPQQRVPGSGGRADEAHRESQGGRCQARWRRALWWEWAVILAPASSPPLGARPGLPGTGARGVSPAGAAGAIVAAIAGPPTVETVVLRRGPRTVSKRRTPTPLCGCAGGCAL